MLSAYHNSIPCCRILRRAANLIKANRLEASESSQSALDDYLYLEAEQLSLQAWRLDSGELFKRVVALIDAVLPHWRGEGKQPSYLLLERLRERSQWGDAVFITAYGPYHAIGHWWEVPPDSDIVAIKGGRGCKALRAHLEHLYSEYRQDGLYSLPLDVLEEIIDFNEGSL